MACPNCGTDWYTSYSNGTTRVGYCQHCSHEVNTPTKDKDFRPMVFIEKPKPKHKQHDRIRKGLK